MISGVWPTGRHRTTHTLLSRTKTQQSLTDAHIPRWTAAVQQAWLSQDTTSWGVASHTCIDSTSVQFYTHTFTH